MGEAGIFAEDDRMELVEGEIVEMTPIGWRHVESVNALTGVLADLRGIGRFVVSVQNPLVLGEHGEHYPDLVLYREGVRGRVPEARDALVVVEVADTSVSYDRNVKLPLYARSGVPGDLAGGPPRRCRRGSLEPARGRLRRGPDVRARRGGALGDPCRGRRVQGGRGAAGVASGSQHDLAAAGDGTLIPSAQSFQRRLWRPPWLHPGYAMMDKKAPPSRNL